MMPKNNQWDPKYPIVKAKTETKMYLDFFRGGNNIFIGEKSVFALLLEDMGVQPHLITPESIDAALIEINSGALVSKVSAVSDALRKIVLAAAQVDLNSDICKKLDQILKNNLLSNISQEEQDLALKSLRSYLYQEGVTHQANNGLTAQLQQNSLWYDDFTPPQDQRTPEQTAAIQQRDAMGPARIGQASIRLLKDSSIEVTSTCVVSRVRQENPESGALIERPDHGPIVTGKTVYHLSLQEGNTFTARKTSSTLEYYDPQIQEILEPKQQETYTVASVAPPTKSAIRKRDKPSTKVGGLELPAVQVIEYAPEVKEKPYASKSKKPEKNYTFVKAIYNEILRFEKATAGSVPQNIKDHFNELKTRVLSGATVVALAALSDTLRIKNVEPDFMSSIDSHPSVQKYRARQELRDLKASVREKITPEMREQINSLLEPLARIRNKIDRFGDRSLLSETYDSMEKLTSDLELFLSISMQPNISQKDKDFARDRVSESGAKVKETLLKISAPIYREKAEFKALRDSVVSDENNTKLQALQDIPTAMSNELDDALTPVQELGDLQEKLEVFLAVSERFKLGEESYKQLEQPTRKEIAEVDNLEHQKDLAQKKLDESMISLARKLFDEDRPGGAERAEKYIDSLMTELIKPLGIKINFERVDRARPAPLSEGNSASINTDFDSFMQDIVDLDKKEFVPEAVQATIEKHTKSSEFQEPFDRMKDMVVRVYEGDPKKIKAKIDNILVMQEQLWNNPNDLKMKEAIEADRVNLVVEDFLVPFVEIQEGIEKEYVDDPEKKTAALEVIAGLKSNLEESVRLFVKEGCPKSRVSAFEASIDENINICKQKLTPFRGLFDKFMALFDRFRKAPYETAMEKQVKNTVADFKDRLHKIKDEAQAAELKANPEENTVSSSLTGG
ncbi:MAG: hypothetical protein Q8R79_02050 [Legionellaceae bacterium]|nr:hypothetical protein [Legionellaceae bacterium]